MIQQNPEISRAPLSYSSCANILHQPKIIRIKIPKLLTKAMQQITYRGGSSHASNGSQDHSKNKRKKWDAPKIRSFSKMLSSIFSNVFGNNRKTDDLQNGDVLQRVSDHNTEAGMPKSHSLREILKVEDDEGKIVRRKGVILSFFNKKTSLKFKKGKISVVTRKGCRHANHDNGANIIVRQESTSSRSLPRVPSTSRILTTRRRLQIARSAMMKARGWEKEEDGEREESSNGDELCKKRILMGERCRPLNNSGVLHYDRNGILLPEINDKDLESISNF